MHALSFKVPQLLLISSHKNIARGGWSQDTGPRFRSFCKLHPCSSEKLKEMFAFLCRVERRQQIVDHKLTASKPSSNTHTHTHTHTRARVLEKLWHWSARPALQHRCSSGLHRDADQSTMVQHRGVGADNHFKGLTHQDQRQRIYTLTLIIRMRAVKRILWDQCSECNKTGKRFALSVHCSFLLVQELQVLCRVSSCSSLLLNCCIEHHQLSLIS